MKVLKVTKNSNVVDMGNLVSRINQFFEILLKREMKDLLIDDSNQTPTTTTLIKTITFEETPDDESGGKKLSNEPVVPQFKQLEPLKMVKRDLSKEFIPSSPSTSSADTIVTAPMRKSLG